MAPLVEGQDRYLAEFERLAPTMSGDAGWLVDLRRQAIARFADVGFPTTREEEWKFTSVTPIVETPFRLAGDGEHRLDPAVIARFALDEVAGVQLVCLNGRFAPHLSTLGALPKGSQADGLARALANDPGTVQPYLAQLAGPNGAFTALNTAFFRDGFFLSIPPNVVVERPIRLLFLSTAPGEATVSHPRVLIVVGENSQVRLIESYGGPDGHLYLTNAVTEIVAGPHAVVDHYKLQRESLQGFHIGSMHIHGQRSSTFSSHSLALGGALVRNEVTTVLDGEGVDCTLNGLYLANGQRLVDNHTTIDHAKPHCSSHEVYKGILGGRSRAIFNGKIIVRPDAQKTDAKQTNKALLLSDDAQINTKPQLEIFANDVKCTHGAAVGQLDEDAIFYLRQRGLDSRQARDLLIQAFAGDILHRIKIEPLRAQLEKTLLAQLPTDSKEGA
jgi:Fe-S cluster assembly protein SufD